MSTDNILERFPTKKIRKPKVIVFDEPKRRNQQQNSSATAKRKRKLEDDDREDVEFADIAREVKEFGMTGFSRKEQRKNKQRYAEHLGAHKQKKQKVPYPILMERVKQRKLKEEKQRKLDEAMGVFKKKNREEKTNLVVKHNLGRWVDKSRIDGIGKRTKNNLRRVNKHEIRKVQNMKT